MYKHVTCNKPRNYPRILLSTEVPARLENTEGFLCRETVTCLTMPQKDNMRRKQLKCNLIHSSLMERLQQFCILIRKTRDTLRRGITRSSRQIFIVTK